jgi:regulatory protein NPR1
MDPLLTTDDEWSGGGAVGGTGSSMEAVSLNRLSKNLERLLIDDDLVCSNADIVVPDCRPAIPVHRCILAVRKTFFHDLFASRCDGGAARSDVVAGAGGAGEVAVGLKQGGGWDRHVNG